MRRLRILTWHVHGSYLYYLSHIPHDIYLLTDDHPGLTSSFSWPKNLREVTLEHVSSLNVDVVIYQSVKNFNVNRFSLPKDLLRRPQIYIEHDPPRESPTDTPHPVCDPNVLVVHVTAFNQLMWNNDRSQTKVIEHGVPEYPLQSHRGELNRGVVVVNNLVERGRRLGADIFAEARRLIPLDLVGMGWQKAGGLGEIPPMNLTPFISSYRFFFNPIRYTSCPLALCEAMMAGLPIVALATTELVTIIKNGEHGFIDTRVASIIDFARRLLRHPEEASEMGLRARELAVERFHIKRFVRDWCETLEETLGTVNSISPKFRARVSSESRSWDTRVSTEGKAYENRIALISEHASPLAALGGVDFGGQNIYVSQLARQLGKRGYKVDVFTRKDSSSLKEIVSINENVRVVHVPAGPQSQVKKEELAPFMPEFSDFVCRFASWQKQPYRLAHAHFWMSGIVAQDLQRKFGVPFVMTFHALGRVRRAFQGEADAFPEVRFSVEDDLMQSAKLIIAECPQDAEDMIRLYGVNPEKLRLVPCGYDPEEMTIIEKSKARTFLAMPRKGKIVLQLGRMVPRKGIDLVIRGFARMAKALKEPSWLYIVGGDFNADGGTRSGPDGGTRSGPDAGTLFEAEWDRDGDRVEFNRLREIAKAEGVFNQVVFVGRKDRHVLRYYYSAADVFVTTPWYEPFGITPVEAMACGTPVIGTRVGGIKYTVVDQVTGLLIEPNDVHGLAEALLKVLCDDRLRVRMSASSHQRVKNLFQWAQVVDQMENVYKEVIKSDQAKFAGVK